MVLMRSPLGLVDMHKEFEKTLIETFERTPFYKSFFSNIIKFQIERKNPLDKTYIKYTIEILLSYENNIPLFVIKNYRLSSLRNAGHAYGDGLMCHNIPPYNASAESGEWYAKSIIEFINSLKTSIVKNFQGQKIILLKSCLEENDLIEYETMLSGLFNIILKNDFESIQIDERFVLKPGDKNIQSPPRFVQIQNQMYTGPSWKVISKEKPDVSLTNGRVVIKARFQPSKILDEQNNNPKNDIVVIGAGSLGSHFIANYTKDYLNGKLTIVDPDIYLYENKDRHFLGMEIQAFFASKAIAMNASLHREILKHSNTNKIVPIVGALGLRTNAKMVAKIKDALENADVIVDLTGTNEPLKYILENKESISADIYKASLYDSGNAMIIGNINKEDGIEEVMNKWNSIRVDMGYQPHSAYSSESPANNTRLSINAAVLNEVINNSVLKKGEFSKYDWRKNIGKTK